MAGILPGVEMPSRRILIRRRREEALAHRDQFIRGRLEQPVTWAATMEMDETALKARQRLEQKLGYFRSSRSNEFQVKEGEAPHHTALRKDTSLGSKILGRPWHFQRTNTSKSDGKVCAVCLEDFGADKQVISLSCSHKYHSKCLLPWLAAHPHCPYCRSPVQS
ncbi:hypothetical protein L1049_016578 [Liquidambar formosana]|uniref:RING-type domain-containing protein n=1 Tax=Liquidambar formosana TaxID=63359 RepID=A0AAP0X7L7_LIQFO